jgi:hypothetical protein
MAMKTPSARNPRFIFPLSLFRLCVHEAFSAAHWLMNEQFLEVPMIRAVL